MSHAKPSRALPRGPHSLSREEVEKSQRARLLLAMTYAVAEKGYANTSVADVISRAGVSRATFYAMFRDKEECFREAYETAAGQIALLMTNGIRAMVAEAFQPGKPKDPVRILDRALTVYLGTLASQPQLARTFLVEVYAAGPKAIEQRRVSMEVFVTLISEALRGIPGMAGDDPDQKFAVRLLVNAVSSMVTSLVGTGEYQRLPELKAPLLRLASGLMDRIAGPAGP